MSEKEERTKPERTWTIREGSPEDADGILECRRVTFVGEDFEKQDPLYWRWEFIDNHAGPARFFVAVDGKDVVGHYAVIPQHFMLNGKRRAGSIVVDVMTHPDYRFQGMFTALGRFAIENCTADRGFEFTTGYPIRPAVLPGHLKVGWKIRFKIGTWVMPLSVGGILKARVSFLGKVPGLSGMLGLLPTAILRVMTRVLLDGGRKYEVERHSKCDMVRFARFWQRFAESIPEGCMVQERPPEYLAWRFDSNPGRDYTYHVAIGEDGEIAGFVVTRVAPLLDVDAMVIVDALALPEIGLAVYQSLIAEVRRTALDRGCPMCAMMVTQPNPLFPNPWRLGFVPTPYRFTFITHELAESTAIDSDDLHWHLLWGDTDDV